MNSINKNVLPLPAGPKENIKVLGVKTKILHQKKLSKLMDRELPLTPSLFPTLILTLPKTVKHFAPLE
jgi:hypothetical protein